MRITILLTLLSWTFFSCNNSRQFDEPKAFTAFDFSYNDVFSTCFSIKFTQGDTVFIREHFASSSSDTPKSGKSYYAILPDLDKNRLDSFIKKTNFAMFDTSYYQNYQDGEEYQFYIDKDSVQKTIYVHSDSVPNELKSFGHWIVELKKNLKLLISNTVVNFGSVRHFLPAKVPTPTMKFTPPRVE